MPPDRLLELRSSACAIKEGCSHVRKGGRRRFGAQASHDVVGNPEPQCIGMCGDEEDVPHSTLQPLIQASLSRQRSPSTDAHLEGGQVTPSGGRVPLMRLWETSSPSRSFRLLQVLGRDPEGWGPGEERERTGQVVGIGRRRMGLVRGMQRRGVSGLV